MKKRKDCFFGIHFDFHALEGQLVAEIWHPEYYTQMLDAVKPDYVQCDTKGHRGFSSYPTEVGSRALLRDDVDILKFMREATKERNIPLYAHHSGVFDIEALVKHPDWAAILPDGTACDSVVSVFSPYADELLIPQLREIAGKYGADGAWIDGDVWATTVDYSPWAIEAYQKEFNAPPPRPEDDDYENYREFCRAGFRNFVRHYISVINTEFPDFEITSNWFGSSFMSEKNDVDIPFISGDYAHENSLENGRWQGRAIESQDVPWDLMAWGHHAIPCSWMATNRSSKELTQYCHEGAIIVAQGGGFEFFNIHYGFGGTIQQWMIPTWQKTAEFVRERKICFQSRIKPEIGVLLPAVRNKKEENSLYCCNKTIGEKFAQWITILQDCQFSTKALRLHQITAEHTAKFKVIVIPDANELPQNVLKTLDDFVNNGGIVIADGRAAKAFAPELAELENSMIWVDGGGALAGGATNFRKDIPTDSTPYGNIYGLNIYDVPSTPAAWIKPGNKGKFAGLSFELGLFYNENRSTAIRDFIKNLLAEMNFKPDVSVQGSRFADLTVAEKNGELLINLINMAGEHNTRCVRGYSEVPPIGPLNIRISPDIKFNNIRQIPENRDLPFTRNSDGSATVVIDKLELHTILHLN